MSISKRWVFWVGLVFCAGIGIAEACPTAQFVRKVDQCKRQQIDYSDGILLVKHLQGALQAGRGGEISDFFSYPLRVNRPGKGHMSVASRAAFLNQYHSIMTSRVRQKIAAADANDIFCNSQGGMAGHGVIWFQQGPNLHLRIYAVNQ